MGTLTLDALKQAVSDAGFEIFRTERNCIRIGERVRMHLMESGVVLWLGDTPRVALTVRVQRSHFPSAAEHEMFERVRDAMRDPTAERGFEECEAKTRDITNPADVSQLLDVWYEITFARASDDVDHLIDDVRWALGIDKCVGP